MKRPYKFIVAALATLAVISAFGFQCSAKSAKFTLKRYSSIPPIVRWTEFSSDGSVTIKDPPNTDRPFTFTMGDKERDSLESLCAQYASFDTLYHPERPIPNPASMDMVFERDGVTKIVHIVQFPPLPPALQKLLDFAGKIEYAGLGMMQR